jgi:hypothetical protein
VDLDDPDLTKPNNPARSSTHSRVPVPPLRFSRCSWLTAGAISGSGSPLRFL